MATEQEVRHIAGLADVGINTEELGFLRTSSMLYWTILISSTGSRGILRSPVTCTT